MNQTMKTSNRKVSESTWLLILMIVSLITMIVHGYLTIQHYQLKLGLSESSSVCNVNATFNCDTVSISRYATLFGIPMALLGLTSQAIFFLLLLTVRFQLSEGTNHIRKLLVWFSLFIAGTSLVMGFFSSVYLGTYCLFCMAAYVLSFVQLFGSWQVQHEGPFSNFAEDLGGLFRQTKWVLILIVLIPALAYFSHKIILDNFGFGKLDVIVQDSLAQWEVEPAQNFKLEQGLSLSQKPEAAKVTIVEFADFLCPHCRTASPSLEAFTQSHPDVRLVFKAFPLDGRCNKGIERAGDGMRCKLTAAVVCSEQLTKKGWLAHHWIFEKQEELYRMGDFGPISDRMTQELGLDPEAFKTCLNADATQDYILAMAQEGVQAKIQGTPTIFVNGKVLQRGQFLPVLEALYLKITK
jgi:protein-disulfide isomerase/uncharacterized membrane protein